jgi:hypothetical protein
MTAEGAVPERIRQRGYLAARPIQALYIQPYDRRYTFSPMTAGAVPDEPIDASP